MAQKSEEFDVLTFFIYVMVLLTLIVGGFALLNRNKLGKDTLKLKGAVRGLGKMEELALDEDFRDWISRERNNAVLSNTDRDNTTGEFRGLVFSLAARQGLQQSLKGRLTPRGVYQDQVTLMKEAMFQLQFDDIRVEKLMRYLVSLEEGWPGCRTTRINELKYNEKTKTWKASIQVSIFNPADD
ncbi:MAG: hypothetical protein JKY65_25315 [Planctomycetes bacterium]|nr:hypothetical protein [Planctomycetota bacterium]